MRKQRVSIALALLQAIIVSIDQYAEAATGNQEYFLNKPHSLARGARRAVRGAVTCRRIRILAFLFLNPAIELRA